MPFDPDAYLAGKPQPFDPDAYLSEESAFDPDEYLAEDTSEESESYTPVADRLDKEPELFTTQTITDDEIAEFSKHYGGVDPELLRDFVILRGGRQEYGEDAAKNIKESLLSFGGRALDVIPGGPAQFIYKKMQDDPNARKAIDDLNQLIDRRRSYASDIADVIVPGLGVFGAAGKAAKLGSKAKKAATLGTAAGIGALEGGMRSSEGDELLGAGVGGAMGLGLGALGDPLIKAGSKVAKKGLDKLPKIPKLPEQPKPITKEGPSLTDKALGILSTRIGNISPEIKSAVRKYDFDTSVKSSRLLRESEPFLMQLKDHPKKNDIAVNLYNGDFKKAASMMPSEMQSEFKSKIVPMLNKLGDDLVEAGYSFKKRDNYFPREVRDYAGLRASLGLEPKGMLNSQLKAYAKKKGVSVAELSKEDRIKVLDNAVQGFPQGVGGGKLKFTKERKLDVDDNSLPYYFNPEQSLASYIRKSVNDIEKRKFFGKAKAGDAGEMDELGLLDVNRSIGRMVDDAMEAGQIKPEQQKELYDLLQARFIGEKQAPHKSLQLVRDLGYMGTIANPISAITQLGDLGVTSGLRGIKDTVGAMFGNKDLKAVDLGIEDLVSKELAMGDPRVTAQALNKLMGYAGFKKIDRLGKEVYLNATLRNAKSALDNPAKLVKLRDEVEPIFGPETDDFLRDLANGRVSENVKLWAFNKLADVQPISLSEMPEAYLRMKNGRLLYMLKSFTLKQLDVVRREIVQEWKKGNRKEAAKKAALLAGYISAANVGTQSVKDILMGREVAPEDLPGKSLWALLGAYGLNEYTFEQYIKKGKLSEGAMRYVAPPIPIIDSIFTLGKEVTSDDPEVEKALRGVPFVGPVLYNWFGGGAEKYNERQRKKRNER